MKIVAKKQLEALANQWANQPAGDFTEPMSIPAWMVIDAVRYCVGRMTYQVSSTCEWLVANWGKLPQRAKVIIERDIEEAFARDDEDRCRGSKSKALGWDCDRVAWETVRALWRKGE